MEYVSPDNDQLTSVTEWHMYHQSNQAALLLLMFQPRVQSTLTSSQVVTTWPVETCPSSETKCWPKWPRSCQPRISATIALPSWSTWEDHVLWSTDGSTLRQRSQETLVWCDARKTVAHSSDSDTCPTSLLMSPIYVFFVWILYIRSLCGGTGLRAHAKMLPFCEVLPWRRGRVELSQRFVVQRVYLHLKQFVVCAYAQTFSRLQGWFVLRSEIFVSKKCLCSDNKTWL